MDLSENLCAYMLRTLHGHFRSEGAHVWYQMFHDCLWSIFCMLGTYCHYAHICEWQCCGWMVNPLEASVTEQSLARSSKSSCWISNNSLLKITWTVTNMQFRSSESHTTVYIWSCAWILEVVENSGTTQEKVIGNASAKVQFNSWHWL